MYISKRIRNESWNGGHWIESVSEYGSYSISINPNDADSKHPRLIVVLDDPEDDEQSTWMRMIPDQEFETLQQITEFVQELYENYGMRDGLNETFNFPGYKVFKKGCLNWVLVEEGDLYTRQFSSLTKILKFIRLQKTRKQLKENK